MSLDTEVKDLPDARRYELHVDGHVAYVEYNNVAGGRLISKTVVPEALEGRGIGSRLAKHVLADLREKDLKILPTCTFFASYIKKHPETYGDLVHDGYRAVLGLAS